MAYPRELAGESAVRFPQPRGPLPGAEKIRTCHPLHPEEAEQKKKGTFANALANQQTGLSALVKLHPESFRRVHLVHSGQHVRRTIRQGSEKLAVHTRFKFDIEQDERKP